MGTEDAATGAQAAPTTTTAPVAVPAAAAEPTKVDPRAAAMAMFDRAREAATTDPKGPAGGAAGTPALPGTSPTSATSTPSSDSPSTTSSAPSSTEAPAQPDRLASGFAKLAREKAAVLARTQELDKRTADITAYDALKAKIAADPAAVLDFLDAADAETALERVAEAYIARKAGKPQPTDAERLAALETERENDRKAVADAKKKADEDAATQTREQQIEGSVAAMKASLSEVAEKFPTIMALGDHPNVMAHRQVFDAVAGYVGKHKLSADQVTFDLVRMVAADVEKGLDEEFGGLIVKVPHIAARVTPPRQETASTGQPTDSGAKGTSSTSLASTQVNGSVPPPQPAGKRWTKEELRAAALAHFGPPG